MLDFNRLLDEACSNAKFAKIRPVVAKELLHYDILYILATNNVLNTVTFQGGTCLRLCYGLQRFSEDLDFAGGKDFSADKFKIIKSLLEQELYSRYNLQCSVKEPSAKHAEEYVSVSTWQLSIITSSDQRDLPAQRIKIEIANVPAYTRSLVPIISNYGFLPDGYNTLVHAETLAEIFADKIVAIAGRSHLKSRDIWDLQWLAQKQIGVNNELVKQKIADYGIKDFSDRLLDRAREIPSFVMSKPFYQEMQRFLDTETVAKTLDMPEFLGFLGKNVSNLLVEYLNNKDKPFLI